MKRVCMTVIALLGIGSLAVWSAPRPQQKSQARPAPGPTVPLRVEEQIDLLISEMLAAYQFGDVELMRQYYADDVSVVSGQWEAVLHGWASYAAGYRRLRERVQGMQLQRQNTYVNVKGNIAYATYQWQMLATVDAAPADVKGHTTLVLEKRGDRWMIVHNHWSIVSSAGGATLPQPQAPAPSKPPLL